ncbi:SDR family oxidoreductase [Qipengyuania sp. 1NDH17]|uniref:SDR family oxidoreductase n=1 Tax=Qipengyuania polymorpha TaxID=2867234 RepID=A0ABS7IZ70_9SPHN|nr:SDR family oxidoreductase [Qipengyuania polymorpha]MBX7458868.1 SDR family oxidoreductase [Qipengyuania polymorpha]
MDRAKTICVTGAGNGIGRAILMHFAGLGWRVIGLDIDSEALAQLRDALPREQALLLTCDTGREGEVSRAFERIAEWLGDDGLDCLVNNSGISDPYCGPLEDLDLADWQAWLDASLTAAFLVSRASLPHLRRAGQASIANISSTRAVMSEPETFAYAAAKGGLDALTHSMAVTLGPDIRVNAIRPGWIETGPWQKRGARSHPEHRDKDREQHPVGRIGRPEDIAGAVEYLHGAGFVTGQHLNIDGGMTVKMIYEH